jgi:hypothetical protein
VRWQGNDDASGIASYDVQVQQDGTVEWTDWLAETTVEESSFAGQSQTGYSFRARSRDAAGRVGPWSTPAHVAVIARSAFLPAVFK